MIRGLPVLALALICACRAHPPAPSVRDTLRPIVLPNLANASPPVQRQLEQQYAALTAATGNRATPIDDLANAYGEMGKLLMAAEYREAAEACLVNAESLATRDPRWPYYLGHLYKLRGDGAKSIAAFERARALQPDDVSTLVWLGEGYLDRGQPALAEPLFAKALARQPQSLAALFGMGRTALARSDYRGAVDHLARALSIDPRAAAVHYPLALAYRGLGDSGSAEQHMRLRGPGEIRPPDPLMLELDALLESAIAYEVRGAKALDDRDWTRAAEAFRRGIEMAPREPSLHHKLGTALYLGGDPAGAAAEFEAALRLDPHFAKAHYSLGIMHGSNGRSAAAIEHLSAAIRDDPAYVAARLRLADILRMSGRSAASLSHYQQAADADPRLAEAPFGYALALADLGRYREARDQFSDGMKRYPAYRGFAHALVRLLAAAPDDRVRDGQAALRLIQRIVAEEPRTYEVAEMMAMTFAEIGQYGDASAWQRDAIAAAERAGRPDAAKEMAGMLTKYEHRQPCRQPWRREDPPGGSPE